MQLNLINIFKFLEKKDNRPIPLRVKLLNNLPLTPEDLDIKGDLDLHSTKITSLPDNLKVSGNLDLYDTPITSLPDDLEVGGNLYLTRTNKLDTLPANLTVGRDLDLSENSQITELPDNLTVGRDLWLRNTQINSIPDNLTVGGEVNLFANPIVKQYMKQTNNDAKKAKLALLRDIESKGGSASSISIVVYIDGTYYT